MNDETRDLLREAHLLAEQYIENADEARVVPSEEDLAALAEFDEPLPAATSDAAETLRLLDRVGTPNTAVQIAGRYFGFVDGGALPVGLAARWLADAWDQNTAHYVMSPIAATLEHVCEGWLVDLLGLPEGTAAGFETGTTLANFSGIAAGRGELLRRHGWDVEAKGLYGAPPIRVLAGEHAHGGVQKVLNMLGMGAAHTEIVPIDDHGRVLARALPEIDSPVLAVIQAGNVNSGAFDEIGTICDAVHAHEGWVHVDGAFGLWAAASPSTAHLCQGLGKADSWAVDAHKTLNVPYDCGIVLCRDRVALRRAFQASGDYLQWSEQRDPMDYTPSMSKRARGIELWAVLKTLGREGVASLIDQLCAHAGTFAEKLVAEGFSVHNDVVFNQVLTSCENDELTQRTLANIQASGECWCGGSLWHGRSVIRVSVCSWATTDADIDRSIRAFVAAREMARTR